MTLEELIHKLPTSIEGSHNRLTIFPWLDGGGLSIEISGIHRETRMYEYSMVYLEIMSEIKKHYGDYFIREEYRGNYSLIRPESRAFYEGWKSKTFAEYYEEQITNVNDL